MSGFLEGLVRRGAGLGPAPGEQTATLRPLSRFEQRPFEAAGAEVGITEAESLVAAARPDAPRARSMAGQPPAPTPAAPIVTRHEELLAERPSMDSRETAAPKVTAGQDTAVPSDIPREAAAAPDLTSPRTPHDRTPPAFEASRSAETPATALVLNEHRTVIEPALLLSPTAMPLPIVSVTQTDASRIEATPQAPQVSPLQDHVSAPAPTASAHDLTPFEIETPQPPQLSISIGRIEIDFGQRTAPPPAPGPQRTRGFEAFARARRGQLR